MKGIFRLPKIHPISIKNLHPHDAKFANGHDAKIQIQNTIQIFYKDSLMFGQLIVDNQVKQPSK